MGDISIKLGRESRYEEMREMRRIMMFSFMYILLENKAKRRKILNDTLA